MGFTCQLCQKEFNKEKLLLNHKCPYCAQCKTIFSTYQRLTSHKCAKGDPTSASTRTVNQPTNQLDIEEIVKPGYYITDDVINRVLLLMTQQWPEVNVAFRLPSVVEVLRREASTADIVLVPVNKHAVNIHYLDSHWVTSWQDPCDLTVKIYDSKQNSNRLMKLLPILRTVYDMKVYSPTYVTVSQQEEVACGAFAAAFAVCCAEHKPPDAFEFRGDMEMRQHLQQCIINSEMTMFPSLQSESNTRVTYETRSVMNILDEIERQKQLQHIKVKPGKCQTNILIRKIKKNVCQRTKRACEKEHYRQDRLQRQRKRQAQYRDKESDLQKKIHRIADKQNKENYRDKESDLQKKRRMQTQKERQDKCRDKESVMQKKRRLQTQKERQDKCKDKESVMQKKRRLQNQ